MSKSNASRWFLLGALKVAALAFIAALMMLAPQSSADANIALARQFNKGCSYCHVPLQEPRLNATGTRFQRCGYRFDCAPGAGPGQQQQNFCANFNCNRGVCNFRIFSGGDVREINLMAGERRRVQGLRAGARWCEVLPNGNCNVRNVNMSPC